MIKQQNEAQQFQTIKKDYDNSFVKAMLERGNQALKVGEWKKADSFYNKVLKTDEKCAEAYLGKYLTSVQKTDLHDCIKGTTDINTVKNNDLLKKAYQHAAGDTKNLIERFYSEVEKKNNDKKPKKKSGIVVAVVAAVTVGIGIVATFGSKMIKPKLEDARVSDVISFGTYEQDNNISNGPETLEWIVLDEKDGELLLISKYAIECMPYNNKYESISWEECTLRSWLNKEFMDAFSDQEIACIVDTKNTDTDKDTVDRIFLLSTSEAKNKDYFESDGARQCQPTAYAKAKNCYTSDNDNCIWWLRSPGRKNYDVAQVFSDGSILEYGNRIDIEYYTVRPAMWINPNT